MLYFHFEAHGLLVGSDVVLRCLEHFSLAAVRSFLGVLISATRPSDHLKHNLIRALKARVLMARRFFVNGAAFAQRSGQRYRFLRRHGRSRSNLFRLLLVFVFDRLGAVNKRFPRLHVPALQRIMIIFQGRAGIALTLMTPIVFHVRHIIEVVVREFDWVLGLRYKVGGCVRVNGASLRVQRIDERADHGILLR